MEDNLKSKLQKKVELLAPAKNKETAFVAIDCGADAVYIGAPAFGARQNASNSLEDIKEVVNYAHKYWARVHITMNTILSDSGLDEAVKMANKLQEIGVDALIIQDMGLLEKLMNVGYKVPIHMSTQCDNYLPQKVKFFNEIGVSRVILARELSIEQIRQIHNENPNLELESFIHGALCVSMSGQCYLSQYIGGRSANRGECAQPCRKQYDVIDEDGNIIAQNIYPLCLKDFNGSKHINELIQAGICSFKIEGRLKDVGYVKNIVAHYRNLLGKGSSSGKCEIPFIPNPEKSFNRGFTDYFLNGRTNCSSIDSPKSQGEYLGKVVKIEKDSFLIETGKEIHNQDGLYFNNDGCLVNKCQKLKNNVTEISPNKKVSVNLGDKIYRNTDVEFEKELEKPVKRQIGVIVVLNNDLSLNIEDENGGTVAMSLPEGEPAKNQYKMNETFVKQISKTGESDFYITDIKIAPDIKIPFIPISKINEFRRNLFDKLMQKRLEIYEKNKLIQKPLRHAKYYQTEVDYRANVYNTSAKEFYEKCGVKVLEPAFEMKQPERQIELMHCKHCIKYALNMCKSPKKLFLKDSHKKSYLLKFNCKNCEMFVLNHE